MNYNILIFNIAVFVAAIFLLDSMANAKDWGEVRCIQKELSEGRYSIGLEARALRGIILDGWTGRAALRTFRKTQEIVEGIIGAGDDDALYPPSPKNYRVMRAVCAEWLKRATSESRWLIEERYREKWQSLGYHIEEEIWGDG